MPSKTDRLSPSIAAREQTLGARKLGAWSPLCAVLFCGLLTLAASAQTLMRSVDKDKLGIALKSANEEVRGFFLGNMSSRAGKMLLDDMAALGPVRLRDVDEAQALLVNLAKDLAAKGEIMLTKNRADDELVY